MMSAVRENMITAVFVLCFSSSCAAATITLKNGSVIRGEILEKTDSYIKVKTHGVSIPYFYSEIKEVGEDSSPGSRSGGERPAGGNSLPGGYVNNEYGVSIVWPKGWDVFQRPVSEEVEGVRIYAKRKSDDTIPYIGMHISRDPPEKILSMVENIASSRKETGEAVILSVPPRDCVMNGMPAKQWVFDFPAVHSPLSSSALKSRVSSPGARELLKGAKYEAFMFIKNGVVVVLEFILHNDERLEKEREEVLSAVNNFKFLK
ncbi:MAG: hypothetical protein WC583_02510 [Candidatus Omnitrophota bacterium]